MLTATLTLIILALIAYLGLVINQREELRSERERLEVQLAGCGAVALGWDNSDCTKGDYGWSASLADVRELRKKYTALFYEKQHVVAPDRNVVSLPPDPVYL